VKDHDDPPVDWIGSRSIDDLVHHRTAILECHVGGMYADHETIIDELGVEHGTDEERMAAWFDRCIDDLRSYFATGSAVLYRAIGVADPEAFAAGVTDGSDLGFHWTSEVGCASTSYHGGTAERFDVLITATVLPNAVDWPTTLQMRFAHPHEKEISVHGGVDVIMVVGMSDDRVLRTFEHLPLAA
jgi:hypothetical protein